MKNTEEHKKLLAQIYELEKNSINYFDVEKEFFLIDSNNLHQIRPRLYGYSIQASGIYEDDNLTPEAVAGLDGRGCYIYVEVKDGKITIKQDLNGSWGIYLFRHGNYFALSNSFFRLLDHVKFKYPLTVNKDYCHHLLIGDLVSHAYFETPVNEIQLLDRSALVQIDIAKKSLEMELIDYKEQSISPDSAEGIATLDRWIEFWGNVYRGVAQQTNFIVNELSGGFDSRITFLTALNSSIDLDKVWIFTTTEKNYSVYIEDYDIASKIVKHYGLTLNKSFEMQRLNYSLTDVFKIKRYSLQPFYKDPWLRNASKFIDKQYKFTGQGGEVIRGYWRGDPEEFIKDQSKRAKSFSAELSNQLSSSLRIILESAFRTIRNKYDITKSNSAYLPQYLYQETRCRVNYGKNILSEYFQNTIILSPSLDPIIRTIQLDTPQCPDPLLLMALIFTRYEPDLLKFPFEGRRSIASETIEYAKKINERFPRFPKDKENFIGGRFCLPPRDARANQILTLDKNNKSLYEETLGTYLNAMFESSRTYGLFNTYFDAELYHHTALFYANKDFGRFRRTYSVWGIAEVLEEVEISNRNLWCNDNKHHFLDEDFCVIPSVNNIINKFKPYLTARIDIKLMSTAGNLEILSVSDSRLSIEKPNWFQKQGIGYVIQSYQGDLKIVAKADTEGEIALYLRGVDKRVPGDRKKRIPYWIDYTKLIINEEEVFDKLTPVWHNEPYVYNFNVKASEEIKIKVEWFPHRSDT